MSDQTTWQTFEAEAKGILPGIQLSDSQRKALTLVADGVVERYS